MNTFYRFIPWLVLAGFVALLALQTVRVWWLARRPRVLARRRARRGLEGERDAEPLLHRAGYRILERQPTGSWRIDVDGEALDLRLRADFLVWRRGRRFVADAKTGERAPRITHGPTRRQLLEYRLAFDVEGVLLVDPERGTVQEIVFPLPPGSPSRGPWWLLAGMGVGAAVAWLLGGP